MTFYTQYVYKVRKSIHMAIISLGGPETGIGDGIPVHVDPSVPDGCSEILLSVVMPAVHLPLQDTQHKIVKNIAV